jgi:hypothetical protein
VRGKNTSINHVNTSPSTLCVVEDIVPVTLHSVRDETQTSDQVGLLDQVIGHGLGDGRGVDDHRVAQSSHRVKLD